MNAGFSSLDSLKQFLLAEDLREQLTYDEALTRLGLGVAAQFDKACNRGFARVAGDAFIASADRGSIVLPRYPVESIATVELRASYAESWVAQTDVIERVQLDAGLVWFAAQLGDTRGQVRITYTGGYWWDVDDGTTQPVGSTPLPEDIRTAWLMQCEAAWLAHDGLGSALAKAERPTAALLREVALLPSVKETLSGYTRYAML